MKKKQTARRRSLRTKMLLLMLVCWLLPMLMVIAGVSYYVYDNYNSHINEEIVGGLDTGLRFSSDRLDAAMAALRRTAYDGIVRDSWAGWKNGLFGWVSLYTETSGYFMNQYRGDTRFPMIAFWFAEDIYNMRFGGYIQEAGGSFRHLTGFWEEDFEAVNEFAKGRDTYAGIYESGGRVYIVRNLTSRFQVIGTQVMELNTDAFFDGLAQTAWGQSLTVWLDDCRIDLSGEAADITSFGISPGQLGAAQGRNGQGDRFFYNCVEGDGYTLSAVISIDNGLLISEMRGYIVILMFMILLLVPMLLVYYRFYDRNITKPVHKLIDGAKRISRGEFGYQVDKRAKSGELQYITDSFNGMSGTLDAQFEQLYRKELSLRDAKIKALQSQINPHFLNNTLEIINWESRLGENVKASQMIEALSTLLDAAMDRQSRPEVRLSEELVYINAYLLIIEQRFGKRMEITKSIEPDTLECMVPRLILQPIVENAVEHGINPGGYGRVDIRAFMEDNNLIIEVENDGEMKEDDKARIERLLSPDYDASKESCYNLGIANVNSRLRMLYGPPSGLAIGEKEGAGVVARMLIAQKEEADDILTDNY